MTTHAKRRQYVINLLSRYEERLGFTPLSPRRSLFLALLVAAYETGAGTLKHSEMRRWVEDRISEIERPLIDYRWQKAERLVVESRHMMGAAALAKALRDGGAEFDELPTLNLLSEWLLRAEAGGLR